MIDLKFLRCKTLHVLSGRGREGDDGPGGRHHSCCSSSEVCGKYVMPVYIRVSVVLSKSLCRKEREKLDITLDSMVVMLARV